MVSDPSPSVGIFWGVRDESGALALVVDLTPLADAEPYGEALTHRGGHYEIWEAWQAMGVTGLKRHGLPSAIAWSEYEEHPRGRIIYDTKSSIFRIYADRRLQGAKLIQRIVVVFGISEKIYSVHSDSHYQ
ncbi:hypothetical protein FV219_00470 [Methylobacterium sp. WL122]|nr:hypothetical protein FV219_00470 [Methylobacterium sp. WL122]